MRVLIIILLAFLTVGSLTFCSKASAEVKGEWQQLPNISSCFLAWERGYKITEHRLDGQKFIFIIIKDLNNYYRLVSRMSGRKQSFACDMLRRDLD